MYCVKIPKLTDQIMKRNWHLPFLGITHLSCETVCVWFVIFITVLYIVEISGSVNVYMCIGLNTLSQCSRVYSKRHTPSSSYLII